MVGTAQQRDAVALLGDEVVAEHPRCFRREQIVYDLWHYLPDLTRKPVFDPGH